MNYRINSTSEIYSVDKGSTMVGQLYHLESVHECKCGEIICIREVLELTYDELFELMDLFQHTCSAAYPPKVWGLYIKEGGAV